jgi:hypothetical protein
LHVEVAVKQRVVEVGKLYVEVAEKQSVDRETTTR